MIGTFELQPILILERSLPIRIFSAVLGPTIGWPSRIPGPERVRVWGNEWLGTGGQLSTLVHVFGKALPCQLSSTGQVVVLEEIITGREGIELFITEKFQAFASI